MLDLTDKVFLITGANRGIGLKCAEVLYRRGARLSLGVRDKRSLDSFLEGRDPQRILIGRYNAEDWASHEAWVGETLARFGRIDGLINNAGISVGVTLRDADEASLDKIWAVNCKAPLNMIRLTLPHLEACGAGRVVNVASMSGKRVRNNNVAYNMTKFAVVALSHATRRMGWDKGLRVTALCPSFVRTDLTRDVTTVAAENMTDPQDLAELVATVISLPNTSSVAELLVNCRLEDMV